MSQGRIMDWAGLEHSKRGMDWLSTGQRPSGGTHRVSGAGVDLKKKSNPAGVDAKKRKTSINNHF